MKHLVYTIFLSFALFLSGCEEIDRGVPVGGDDMAPSPVSDVQITNTPGGATISYVLPKSDNLLYVLAEYAFNDGVLLEKKSSFFGNTITLEGFPDTNPYEVKLYAVSRGDKRSVPVTVTVNPLTPPVLSAFMSLSVKPTFGGVKVGFENESEANLKMIVLTTDSVGDFYSAQTYYTKRKEGEFSVRGFDAVERTFGVYTLDRWGNRSDTLLVQLTPWFEQKLDKTGFKAVPLPTDTWEPHINSSYSMEAMWDEVWGTGGAFHTKPNTGIPQWFTIDLGVSARLSRFKFYHRYSTGSAGQYSAGDPQIIEVYGSNEPASDGSWDSWTSLGEFQSIKPSGDAKWTDEDIQFACFEGEDFEFNVELPYRYLRFKILKNWGGVSYIYISELTFWGEVLEGSE